MWLLLGLVARAEALVATDVAFEPDTGAFGAFQFTLELRGHLTRGRRPFGLSTGLGLDWLLSDDYQGAVIGPHVEARWSRMSYGSFSVFGRAGYCFEAWDNYGDVFTPYLSAALEGGYTWRSDYRQGPRVGVSAQFFTITAGYDRLIATPTLLEARSPDAQPPVDPADPADPGADVPLPNLRGRTAPLTDPSFSFGLALPVIGGY